MPMYKQHAVFNSCILEWGWLAVFQLYVLYIPRKGGYLEYLNSYSYNTI
jgi:hypothetical protein